MRRPILFLLFCCVVGLGFTAAGAEGRVIKVLPHFLDLQGRHAMAPSLYDRDAYQAFLREHTNQISGVRFDVQSKVSKASEATWGHLLLRIELRGTAKGNLPSRYVLETAIQPRWFRRWTSLPFTGEDYQKFGQVTAWRVTLWEGETLLDEQKSFLW